MSLATSLDYRSQSFQSITKSSSLQLQNPILLYTLKGKHHEIFPLPTPLPPQRRQPPRTNRTSISRTCITQRTDPQPRILRPAVLRAVDRHTSRNHRTGLHELDAPPARYPRRHIHGVQVHADGHQYSGLRDVCVAVVHGGDYVFCADCVYGYGDGGGAECRVGV